MFRENVCNVSLSLLSYSYNVIKAWGCSGVKSSVKPYYNIYVIDSLSYFCLASLSFLILDIAKI